MPGGAKIATTEAEPLPPVSAASLVLRFLRLPTILPGITLILLVIAWQIIVSVFNVPPYLVPSPLAVWRAGIANRNLILDNAWVTTLETLIGFFLSALIGIAIAIGIAAWPLASRAIYPLLVSSQVVPKVAIAPLVALWIGTGVRTSSLIAFVMAFFPVVVNATLGLNSADPESIHLIRSMGGSNWTIFRYLRIPGALPFIWSGLQLAMAFSVVGAVVGEFVGASSGIGYLLIVAEGNLRTDVLFASIVVVTVIGLVLYYAVEWMSRLTMKWN